MKSTFNSVIVSARISDTKKDLEKGGLNPSEEQRLTAQLAAFEQFLLDYPLPVQPKPEPK